jgi:hypothetical protein
VKRQRPADEIRRWAVKARLQGMSSRAIAQALNRSHDTIRGYLGSCGGMVEGAYHLNRAIASALFTEQELVELGAIWNGHCWVGSRRKSANSRATKRALSADL